MDCAGKTKLGQPCRGHALTGSKFCFFHDAASRLERLAAQSKGGRNRSHLELITTLPNSDFDLREPESSAALLNFVVNRLVRGQIEPKVACAIGYIVGLSRHVNEARDYERSKSPDSDGMESATEHKIDLLDLPEQAGEILAGYTDGELLDLLGATSNRKGRAIGADHPSVGATDSPKEASGF